LTRRSSATRRFALDETMAAYDAFADAANAEALKVLLEGSSDGGGAAASATAATAGRP
jgi:hypothetical protein